MDKIIKNLNELRTKCKEYYDGQGLTGTEVVKIVETLEYLFGEVERIRHHVLELHTKIGKIK